MKKRAPEVGITNYHSELEGFYKEKKNTIDVIFLGSSHAYESFLGPVLFQEYGITGYTLSSSSQTVWQSYYYLKNAFTHQHPKVVIYECFEVYNSGAQSEVFNREAIDRMELGNARFASSHVAYEKNPDYEYLLSYYLPLLRYHDRWEDLNEGDFDYFFQPNKSMTKGGMLRMQINPAIFNSEQYGEDISPAILDGESQKYLKLIKEECKKNGADLIFVTSPTVLWDGSRAKGIEAWAYTNGIPYYDYNANPDLRQRVGIDWNKDILDGGNHINYYGELKMTREIGSILSKNYNFSYKRCDKSYSEWNDCYDYVVRCVGNYELTTLTNLDQYLSKAETAGYTVIKSDTRLENSNVSIIKDGKSVYEYNGYEQVETSIELDDEIVKVFSACHDLDIDGFSCIYKKNNIAKQGNGLNVIILDNKLHECIDSSLWNLDEDGVYERIIQ